MAKRAKDPAAAEIIDRNAQARESEAAARQTNEAAAVAKDRQIAEAVGNTNDKQLNARNAIADSLDTLPERTMLDFDGDNIVTGEEAAGADVDAATAAEREAEQAERSAQAERERLETEANARAAESSSSEVTASPKTYKLKINGKDVELTEAEVLERAQKVASADEYLQFAKKTVEQRQAPPPSQDESASGTDDAIEDTLTSALQGDKEAIAQIAQRLKAPSRPDVLSAVDDRLSFRSAVEWFRDEYKDIVGDPMLYQLAVSEDSRLLRAEPTLSYRERLKRAGEHVRGWKAGLTKSATPPVNPKLARKAEVAPVPQAGGRQAAPEDTEEEEPIETVIDKMARARHQGGAIRKQ